jgi:LPXTG-site transpeptidase (sortase) family protein
VTKDDGVASVDAGGTTTYTVRVTNVGPSSVTGAILSDPVAAGLSKTGVVCSGTPGECVTPPTVGQLEGGTFALPALASGEFYEIDVTVDVTAASGSVTNTATVAAPAGVGDPVPGNDSASDTDTVIIPSIIINDVTVQESDGVATFTVALSNPSSATITVDYATSDNTAVDGADYNATSNVLIFAPGETTKTIDVTILEDLIDETAETFFVNLSNSTNSVIADAQGLGTILDNDPVPSIIINDVTVLESDGVATFTVALSNPSSSTITVDYATSDNTAIAGLDYVSTSNVLTFTPGETSKTVDVTILSDVIFELSETFFVNLSNPTNSTIADAQGVGTILDNAVAPGISKSFSPDSITLGSTSTLTINLSNSNPVAATLTSPFVDTLPANVVVAATPNIGGTCAGTVGASAGGSTITYASGSTIPPGGCTIEVDVSSTAVGTHTNTIDVGDLQTTLGNNTSPTSDDLVVLAATITDPAITKTGDPATAQVGDTVIFTLEVTNNGPAAATDVVVEDVLPTFLTFSSITAPGGAWTYDAPTNTVTITYATVLPGDLFTIVIRTVVNSLGSPPGGTNTASLTSDPLDRDLGNNDASAPITIVVVSDLRAPETGFTPGVQTEIPAQTAEKAYADYAELTLSIPALKVSAPIVGVPLDTDGWDVAWLWNRVGYLEGTAFPGWDGNSVLTSHVYLPNGLPGPFIGLKELQWGDRVILEAYSLRYIYEVRESRFYLPGDHRIIRHEESPWLTLVTCHSYDEATETYRWRRVVRAVLVSIDTT